jgi:hypothetical protein
MQQRYEQFLRQPTATRYLALRASLLKQFGVPKPLAIHRLQRDIRRGLATAAIRPQINVLSSGWLLSPRFHLLVAEFAERREDAEQLELSLFEAQSCLAGLVATGDGSRDRPYQSTYPTDVQDVATAQRLRVEAQHLVQRQSRWFDLATCSNRELWFARPMPALVPETPVFRD